MRTDRIDLQLQPLGGHTGGFPATPCFQSTFTALHSPVCSMTLQLLLEKKLSQLFLLQFKLFIAEQFMHEHRAVRSRSNWSWTS